MIFINIFKIKSFVIFFKNFFVRSLLNVKKGFLKKKPHAFIIVCILIFVVFLGLYRLALMLAVYSLIYLFFEGQEKKAVSFQEILRLKYKSIVLNRKYLRIKRFWKTDFKRKYKSVQFYILAWQVPFIMLLSFYNALSTRYDIVSTIFYIRCIMLVIVFKNPLGCILILLLYLPLVVLTLMCAIPLIVNCLNETYGPHTIKKLGFNHWIYHLKSHSAKIGVGVAAGAAIYGTYETANFVIVEEKKVVAVANRYKIYNNRYQIWEIHQASGRFNLGPAPSPPTDEEVKQIYEEIEKNRVLPNLGKVFDFGDRWKK